ncbi:MAG: undecaprenyl-phosphate glucose phosphotransferase [Rhodospirillales bacterium]|nr:undecaprenyl-phosphate glucose phosphotransferase [Rhodospirillales bacterium]
MSRIGPTLRPAVLRSSHASAASLFDAGLAPPPPLQPVAASLTAAGLDAAICIGMPFLAASMVPDAPRTELVGRLALLLVVLVLAGAAANGAYRHAVLFRRGEQVRAVLRAGAAALAVMALAVALLSDPADLSPVWAGGAAVLVLGGLALGRLAVARALAGGAGRRFAQRTVIVGSGLVGARLLRLLRQFDERSVRIVGIVDDHADLPEGLIDGVPVLGAVMHLLALVRRGVVDEVVLALPWSEERRILELIDMLSDYPVHVRLAPDLISYHFPRRVQLDLQGHPMLQVAERPISGWRSVLKRAEDLLVGGVALLLCAIPMAMIVLAIRLDSPGPALFRQKRTGFNNHEFEMLKFRTMHHHMAEYSICRQTTRNDPRVTRIGAILRRTSLDELPQIFNVLRGEMSIVGPRPHAPGTCAGSRPFEQVVDRYAARHRVKPGLTGLAQVRGYRGETRTEDKLIRRVECDLEYIDTWSLWRDLVIMLRTLIIVLRMQNAY